jgi:hypothetical protein
VPIETTCEATGAAAPMIRVSGQCVFISPLLMIKAAGVAKSPTGLARVVKHAHSTPAALFVPLLSETI